jgi:type IV pilus assembly protein PilB
MHLKRKTDKPFGEILVERGLIDRKQLGVALEVQRDKGGMIGEILVSLGYVREDQIAHTLSLIYGFPYLPLENYEISSEMTQVVPRRVAEHYCILPVDKIGDSITLAMANPLNTFAIEDVEYLSHCEAQVFISTTSDIRNAITALYERK